MPDAVQQELYVVPKYEWMRGIITILVVLMLHHVTLHDMELSDDAFHAALPPHIETWYFEAIFDNTESMVFMITSLSDGKKGIIMTGVHLYCHGEIVYEKRELHTSFYLSDEMPFIVVNEQELMRGVLNARNNMQYRLSYVSDCLSFHLVYENITRGWKNGDETWIAVPHLQIRGNMSYQGEKREVAGKGYHDHNIFFLSAPLVQRGYFNGKILAENYSIFWARLMWRMAPLEDFVVFSNGSYTLLSGDVSIRCAGYAWNHGFLIPKVFSIYAEGNGIRINVTLTAHTIHFIRLPFVRYWRYHIYADGVVRRGSDIIQVHTYDMMEYLLFTWH